LFLSPRQFYAQLRRLGVVLALASALVWLAMPHAHAATRHHRHYRHHPHGRDLVAVAQPYIGRGNFTGFHGKWCAAAVGRWLTQAGFRRLPSLRAIDYRHYGRPSGPVHGAIAVMRHHIGIVVGLSGRGVLILSGNHSHRVGLGVYSARKIVAYRRPV
jgi:hypothetical protein